MPSKDPLDDYPPTSTTAGAPPPAYNSPLFEEEEGTSNQPRTFGDNIPDDFKYSVNVASCELPIRQMFIRKVYALLTAQITLSLIVGTIIHYSSDGFKEFMFNHLWIFYVNLFATFGFLGVCFFKARSYPINLVLLGLFTVSEAFSVGIATLFIDSSVLLNAILLTLVIFIGLTIFTFQTKYDFTSWESYAGMFIWILISWSFLLMFFPGFNTSFTENIYGLFGAILFSVYIIIDTQKIMTVNHLDDEVMSCIQLYLDIINLFLFIVRLLNNNRND
ncbi:inhibitor of apoptosis-promoting Bax1-domain-containing protein [Scheffersomyces coipomensis]|uniref:inhibitor of apoptosis-promoting Bax1-domain-containing protein n=1 Tax=Scheffersomyces coipomensis TaxID=1788519 RepID=UPI00315DBA4A